MRSSACIALSALCGSLLTETPLAAQSGKGSITATAGFGNASDSYQSGCGHSSLAFGLSANGSSRVFPSVSLVRFAGSGGADIVCILGGSPQEVGRGGVELEGATQLQIGAGTGIGGRRLRAEAVLSGGIIRGQLGFSPETTRSETTTRPQIGGAFSLIMVRHLVLSTTINWTRLNLVVSDLTGVALRRRDSWSPMGTFQVGVRFPFGRSE